MHALVVYESMYGNTMRIAEAIAAGLAGHMIVETVEVSEAPHAIAPDVDLLVVGGPTHAHGMTSAQSRANAATKTPTPVISQGIGIREWLEQVRPEGRATPAVTFDTRIKGPQILTGSAANGYASKLDGAGFRVTAPAESFFVSVTASTDQGLLDGEHGRARAWGEELGATLASRVAIPVG